MTTKFELAQQAANLAYDMTLDQTGDGMQAADDYKSVMTKYHEACTLRGIVNAMEREGQRREAQPTEAEMIAIVQEALTQPAIEY